jgi:hypothetical protein
MPQVEWCKSEPSREGRRIPLLVCHFLSALLVSSLTPDFVIKILGIREVNHPEGHELLRFESVVTLWVVCTW